MATQMPFADRLCSRIERCSSRLVVGLDPVLERMPTTLGGQDPEEALVSFCVAVLEAVADKVAAVKPQSAFFERHGWQGVRALQRVVVEAAKRDIPVILDAKRGDIGSTAAAYAAAYLGDDPTTLGPSVDALTVNPYLGSDSMEPFIEHARDGGRGLFVLARTSNPGGGEFQQIADADGPVFLAVARSVERWGEALIGDCGYSPIGLVAGATYADDLVALREAAPHAFFLLPGIGAQGGDVSALSAVFDDRGLGGLVASSRSIIYAPATDGQDWQEAVAAAAEEMRVRVEEICGGST